MVATEIYCFTKEKLDIPQYLKAAVPYELCEKFYHARKIAGNVFKLTRRLETRHASRYYAMCPSSHESFPMHYTSMQRLFSWESDYHSQHVTLAPTPKLDREILLFHINQEAYETYADMYTRYYTGFCAKDYPMWLDAKRMVEVTAASSVLNHMDRRMWNDFWYGFTDEMYKWESRVPRLALPAWKDIVEEVYNAILERVEGAEELAEHSLQTHGNPHDPLLKKHIQKV
ncbi:hypothetical protein BDV25DRAFT_134294 [Aspergillus avenaceus]|uniref:Uncharacterized protein n=1 Tax=Aspergillus avenaceus TaxID=36643 RepID=A0A5N6TEV4_ASPAV|nr:hypothetical protein BDV25DRAFT_134294 [Aspergillus avenaceus]